MTVHSWIRKESYLLKTFVANRVATIQDLTKVQQWRHVPSENNPSDLISRGMDPEKLVKNKLWLEGPAFLTERDCPNREIRTYVISNEFSGEIKHLQQSDLPVLIVTYNPFIQELFDITNCYTKILYIVSYIFRFIHNLKNQTERSFDPLEIEEIKKIEYFSIKDVQSSAFPEEVKYLIRRKNIPDKSKIKCLNAFLDRD